MFIDKLNHIVFQHFIRVTEKNVHNLSKELYAMSKKLTTKEQKNIQSFSPDNPNEFLRILLQINELKSASYFNNKNKYKHTHTHTNVIMTIRMNVMYVNGKIVECMNEKKISTVFIYAHLYLCMCVFVAHFFFSISS